MCQSLPNRAGRRHRFALATVLVPTCTSLKTPPSKAISPRTTKSSCLSSAAKYRVRNKKNRVSFAASVPSSPDQTPDYGMMKPDVEPPMSVVLAIRAIKAHHTEIQEDEERRQNVDQYINLVLEAQMDQWVQGIRNPKSLAELAREYSQKDATQAFVEGLQAQAELVN